MNKIVIAGISTLFLLGCASSKEQRPTPTPAPVARPAEVYPPEAPLLAMPDGRPTDLGYGFTLYRDRQNEVIVTPRGGQIFGAPRGPGLACTKTLGLDCRVKYLTMVNGTLYLITNQQVYRVTPDSTWYNLVPLDNSKFKSVTFEILSDKSDALIAWGHGDRRFAGILAHYPNGWNLLEVTSKYQAKLKKLTPPDVIGLRTMGSNTYGIVLNNKTLLTVTAKPVPLMIGSLP